MKYTDWIECKINGQPARCRFQYDVPEAKEAKPESATTDCSADGSAAPTPTKPGVQPAGPEQTLARHVKEQIQERIEFLDEHSPYDESTTRHILQELDVYYWMLNWHLEGEAGGGQDDRSRPAG